MAINPCAPCDCPQAHGRDEVDWRISVLSALCSIAGNTPAAPITTANATPTSTIATGAGTVTAGKMKVRIQNTGDANGTVLGALLLPTQVVEFSGYFDNFQNILFRLGAIAYDGTGTSLDITVVP